MMPRKKTRYRIVPTNNESLGSCWALKDGDTIIGTFMNKPAAERRLLQLDQKAFEDFLLNSSKNQELKID